MVELGSILGYCTIKLQLLVEARSLTLSQPDSIDLRQVLMLLRQRSKLWDGQEVENAKAVLEAETRQARVTAHALSGLPSPASAKLCKASTTSHLPSTILVPRSTISH